MFLMQTCFPDKTATQLKTKFKAEQKKHPSRFNDTLNSRIALDKDEYEDHFGAIESGSGSGWEPTINEASADATEDARQDQSTLPIESNIPSSTPAATSDSYGYDRVKFSSVAPQSTEDLLMSLFWWRHAKID